MFLGRRERFEVEGYMKKAPRYSHQKSILNT
jgi:hypothetical protein